MNVYVGGKKLNWANLLKVLNMSFIARCCIKKKNPRKMTWSITAVIALKNEKEFRNTVQCFTNITISM